MRRTSVMLAAKETEKLPGGFIIEWQFEEVVQIKKAPIEAMSLDGAQGLAGRIHPTRLAPGHEFQGRVSHDPVLVGESGDVFFAEKHGISL
jgi:hypothetical protein